MKTSKRGRDFIARWEGGAFLKPYRDPIGLWTVGVGHLIKPGEDYSAGITAEQADELFAADLEPCERALGPVVHLLGQNQFDALVSWLFNCGAGAFAASSVRRAILDGRKSDVPAALELWCRAAGKIKQGLLNRRRSEGWLWSQPDPIVVPPGPVLEDLAALALCRGLDVGEIGDLLDDLRDQERRERDAELDLELSGAKTDPAPPTLPDA